MSNFIEIGVRGFNLERVRFVEKYYDNETYGILFHFEQDQTFLLHFPDGKDNRDKEFKRIINQGWRN